MDILSWDPYHEASVIPLKNLKNGMDIIVKHYFIPSKKDTCFSDFPSVIAVLF